MAVHLKISVDIDAAAVENMAEHAALAADQGVMTRDELRDWMSEELGRYVTCR